MTCMLFLHPLRWRLGIVARATCGDQIPPMIFLASTVSTSQCCLDDRQDCEPEIRNASCRRQISLGTEIRAVDGFVHGSDIHLAPVRTSPACAYCMPVVDPTNKHTGLPSARISRSTPLAALALQPTLPAALGIGLCLRLCERHPPPAFQPAPGARVRREDPLSR